MSTLEAIRADVQAQIDRRPTRKGFLMALTDKQQQELYDKIMAYPGNRENPEFLAELAASVPKDTPVMFLCRSGARSHAAAEAATRAGWKEAYNVLEGFEGDKDAEQHRSTVGGWRKAGLPWVQS